MLRLNKKLGIFLAIASFAMTLAAQWLHSPLHHLVDAIETEDQRHNHQQDSECEEQKTPESSHCHSHHGSHSHSHCHSHSTAENEKSDANSESHPPCNHHHPDGDCEICQFLAEKCSHSQISIGLTGTESAEAASESAAEIVESQTRFRFFVRGPPSHA